jgi:hypothetical protein
MIEETNFTDKIGSEHVKASISIGKKYYVCKCIERWYN